MPRPRREIQAAGRSPATMETPSGHLQDSATLRPISTSWLIRRPWQPLFPAALGFAAYLGAAIWPENVFGTPGVLATSGALFALAGGLIVYRQQLVDTRERRLFAFRADLDLTIRTLGADGEGALSLHGPDGEVRKIRAFFVEPTVFSHMAIQGDLGDRAQRALLSLSSKIAIYNRRADGLMATLSSGMAASKDGQQHLLLNLEPFYLAPMEELRKEIVKIAKNMHDELMQAR